MLKCCILFVVEQVQVDLVKQQRLHNESLPFEVAIAEALHLTRG